MSDLQSDINNIIPRVRKIQHGLDAYPNDPTCKDAKMALERAVKLLERARGYLGPWTEMGDNIQDEDGYPLDD